MKKERNNFIYWTPRILSIIFIIFLTMFSLDIISPELTFWQILLGLFIHNIPVFILTALLIISWKHEWVGGATFILAGILYIIIILTNIGQQRWQILLIRAIIIAGPAFLIGALFTIGWIKKARR
ncbi:MAG: hypothetical protein OEL87_02415 [Nanoarchaeota archaeon]|nr:hypothetical protein [Nanoarchaeota archaeon]